MYKYMLSILILMMLFACGAAPSIPAQGVIDKFKEAGIEITNVRTPEREADSPLPNTFKERLTFETPGASEGKGGQVFVCDTKRNCDALYAYFDAFKALVGPYLYQSSSGMVVVQLNDKLTPDAASKFEQVVKALP